MDWTSPSPALYFYVAAPRFYAAASAPPARSTHTHTEKERERERAKLLLLCGSQDRYVNFGTSRKFICINNFPNQLKAPRIQGKAYTHARGYTKASWGREKEEKKKRRRAIDIYGRSVHQGGRQVFCSSWLDADWSTSRLAPRSRKKYKNKSPGLLYSSILVSSIDF